MSEILTLQFGHFSNFVGAHLWNLQEQSFISNGPGSHLSRIFTLCGEERERRYAPRMVLFDLKGSLGSFSSSRCMPASSLERETLIHEATLFGQTWEQQKIVCQQKEMAQKSSFHQFLDKFEEKKEKARRRRVERVLGKGKGKEEEEEELVYDSGILDEEVEVWTDYLSMIYHPKSIFEVNQHHYEVDDFLDPNDGFEALKSVESIDNALDKIRIFAEDCESLQGFQVLCDTNTSFASYCSVALENIIDEYGKKTILTFGLEGCPPKHYAEEHTKRFLSYTKTLNSAISMAKVADYSSLFVPVGQFDSVVEKYHLQQNNWYHLSAVTAGAIDGVLSHMGGSLRSEPPLSLASLAYTLETGARRNYCGLSYGSPFNVRDVEGSLFQDQQLCHMTLNSQHQKQQQKQHQPYGVYGCLRTEKQDVNTRESFQKLLAPTPKKYSTVLPPLHYPISYPSPFLHSSSSSSSSSSSPSPTSSLSLLYSGAPLVPLLRSHLEGVRALGRDKVYQMEQLLEKEVMEEMEEMLEESVERWED